MAKSRVSTAAMREAEQRAQEEAENERKSIAAQVAAQDNAVHRQRREEREERAAACACGVNHMTNRRLFPPSPAWEHRLRPAQNNPPSARLYLGNLPFREDPDRLEKAIRGMVGAHCTVQFVTREGRFAGLAFLGFVSPDRARESIELLHDHFLGGRKLSCEFARPRERRR